MLYIWNTLRFRKYWILHIFKNRNLGELPLIQELECDPEMYLKYLRMDKRTFEKLLSFVEPHIIYWSVISTCGKALHRNSGWRSLSGRAVTKIWTHPQKTLRPALISQAGYMLANRYLSSGASCATSAICFRVSHSIVCKIVHEIYNFLQPGNQSTFNVHWKTIGKLLLKTFMTVGNSLRAQRRSMGSTFVFNPWQIPGPSTDITSTCQVLCFLPCAMRKYCFAVVVDIDAYGRHSDGGVLHNSNLGKALRTGE